ELAGKRALDVVISGLLLVVLAPLLLLISLLVVTTSEGPLFYVCHWVGQGERRFSGLKFRTMVTNADALEAQLAAHNEMTGPAFKMTNDPRVTPLGRVLRRYSLDELPQLWNVLKGDISLVGPRAPREHEFAQFSEFQKQKLTVQPGITCLWQVEGRHRISDYDRWVEMDLDYIRRWSLWLDLQILAKTAVVVVKGTGV
ncbi:sugar transferase, partial [Phenylobacterium aquaticum]|uniref:sugar transferase n=1 Tax=Phenylobacterium aquaticum TaxID=1763816 RepID=UPI0026F291F7